MSSFEWGDRVMTPKNVYASDGPCGSRGGGRTVPGGQTGSIIGVVDAGPTAVGCKKYLVEFDRPWKGCAYGREWLMEWNLTEITILDRLAAI